MSENIKYDKKRTEFLAKKGYKVLRFWNNIIFKNIFNVLEIIYFHLKNPDSTNPSPSQLRPNGLVSLTLPQGEGD